MEAGENVKQVFMKFGIDESYKAPGVIMDILFNEVERKRLFNELLVVMDYNVSFDWFYEYFQNEHAERKSKKQDFTPPCVADLLSKIALVSGGNNGNYYECCAGTGGIMIKHWDNHRKTYTPFSYKPYYHFAFVEELSDRSIPFLLLNMMVRGINGIVIHGDSLTRKCKNVYFICNTENDHMKFSGISVIPHTKEFEEEFHIKFIDNNFLDHKELMDVSDIYRFEEMYKCCNVR